MRVLLLNTDYPEFIAQWYRDHPGLERRPYAEQLASRMSSLFGVADFYSRNLTALGHPSAEVLANHLPLQRAWAVEHGVPCVTREWTWRMRRGIVPWIGRRDTTRWMYDILAARIRHDRPDVLINQDLTLDTGFLREVKPYVRRLVGQHAATPLPDGKNWGVYDLVVSSFPPTVAWLRQRGVPAQRHRLAFEPDVRDRLNGDTGRVPVSFIGSFFPVHRSRLQWLNALCRHIGVRVWGPSAPSRDAWPDLADAYRGPCWGLEMYRRLRGSRITLNHHGDVGPHANNLRLFEATGIGTLLMTDWKPDLHELFQPDVEVATYRTVEDCAEQVRHYLDHDAERKRIAEAGQRRTLREHTYAQRMAELADIVKRYL